jgi:hypothetical protein
LRPRVDPAATARLSGNLVPAPECLSLPRTDFIPSGGQQSHEFEAGEAEKYQCCIHLYGKEHRDQQGPSHQGTKEFPAARDLR